MTANVVGQSGKTVEVATLADVSGEAQDIPVATSSTAGVVKVGTNISVASDGTISIPPALPSSYGVVQIGSRLTGGGNGVINVPLANRATAGVVKVGLTMSFGTDGTIDVYAAKTSALGAVFKAAQVADVSTTTVTDINSAATAIAQIGTTLSELMQSLRAAGILDSGS